MTSVVDTCFSRSYAEARRRFLDGCARNRLEVTSYENPLPGPGGEVLATDVARLGPADAERVLVLESGTHGVEGYAGSGIQVGVLTAPDAPRPGERTALLLVHAINPYGFAWTRRFNEDNVDLNRHFVDHAAGRYPENPGYVELADAILPPERTPEAMAAAEARFAAYAREHGDVALRTALKRGQHVDPKGLFFGGNRASWSARTVQRIADEHLSRARWAALIDVHTGLGPYGFGECLTPCAPDSEEGLRASDWYGDVTHTMDSSSGYAGSQATIVTGYMTAAPGLKWTCVGLEFGTRPSRQVRDAVRADGWLHSYGSPDHPDAPKIKADLLDAFYPDDPEWRAKVLARGVELTRQGLEGLARLA